uniref:Uncharacterized protein n=1 Tax=Thermogemmatispora argillosa TaxID=2045280 RepID=A0A455T2Q2_9CHLR|nr:hypothetical protein KTA_09640 [Thermogemmatispora argillosa]
MHEPVNDRQLVVLRYWLRENAPALAWALHRYMVLLMLAQLVVGMILLLLCFVWHLYALASILFLLHSFGTVVLSNRWQRYNGIYEVDAAGRPRAFVSRTVLPGLTLRNSLGRKRFLQRVSLQAAGGHALELEQQPPTLR